jgi:hypothetical protein
MFMELISVAQNHSLTAFHCVSTHRIPVPNDKWLQCNDSAKVRIQHLHQLFGGQAPHIQVLPAVINCITISLLEKLHSFEEQKYYKGGRQILSRRMVYFKYQPHILTEVYTLSLSPSRPMFAVLLGINDTKI